MIRAVGGGPLLPPPLHPRSRNLHLKCLVRHAAVSRSWCVSELHFQLYPLQHKQTIMYTLSIVGWSFSFTRLLVVIKYEKNY